MKLVKDETEQDVIKLAANRVKVVRVDPRILVNFFATGIINVEVNGVPPDCKFRGWAHDFNNNCINLFLEHESFDLVEQGTPCPIHEVKFKNIRPEINQARQGE